MPELPEVETVRRGLEPVLKGARLDRALVRRPDLRFKFPPRFVERLTGARVDDLTRRGKFLLAHLDTGETLIAHLGMSGRFEVDRGGRRSRVLDARRKHEHVVLVTDANARIGYVDARRFGFMDLAPTTRLWDHPRLAELGPEPLGASFSVEWLASAFASRRQGVKTMLLDQRTVAGLGNIYASEALHRARIDPARPAGELGAGPIARLAPAVRTVLAEAIASGGSTLRDYAAADGSPGYFQHRFRVYGRAGEACLRRGCRGRIRRTIQAGRATFHCPACQA